MKEISRKLYIIRILHNLTQTYVAEQLGISPSTYVSIEQGLTNIHYTRLESILAIYKLTLHNFFAFTEEDILSVVKGKSTITPHVDPSMYPRLVTKLEALNKVLFQLLQRHMEQTKLELKQLNSNKK